MGLGQLRRYEVQASYASCLALASVVPFVGAAILATRNYNNDLGQIVYGAGTLFFLSYVGCALSSMLVAAIAFFLGLNSAGQRRNDRPRQSWTGFFLGGFIVTGNLILLIALLMLRFEQPV